MQDHEFAAVFPLLDAAGLDELAKDILANGQSDPILIFEDRILDGRNRYRACHAVKVTPITVQAKVADRDAALRLVISRNVHRRHLTEAQRAMAALSVLPMFEAIAAERRAATQGRPSCEKLRAPVPAVSEERRARDDAAALFSVSARTIANVKAVTEHGVPELAQAVRDGHIGAKPAAALARMDEDAQREVVTLVDGGETAAAAIKVVTSAAFSSASDLWYTPDPVLQAAWEVLDCIDLDPASCAEANATVMAERYFTAEDDGLAQEWAGRVWLNPPYGRDKAGRSNQEQWSQKLIESYKSGAVTEALMLVTFSPDRQWFAPLWDYALCAFSSRLRFARPGGDVPSGPVDANVCVYLGPNVDAFERAFRRFGRILVPSGRVSEIRP